MSTLMLGLAAAPEAVAAGVEPGRPLAQAALQQDYAIPPSALDAALAAFGARSGLQVLYAADLARGRHSPGVQGRLPPDQALATLLAGTGLTFRYTNPETITIVPVPQADATAGAAMVLPPLQVGASVASPIGPDIGYVPARTETGAKTDTPLTEVPQSISVVTRAQIEARAAQEDSQVLLYTPGILAQPFGGSLSQYNPHFLIRGFPTGVAGSFLDGLTLPTNYRTEPYGLERSEVLRGPTSVLYGRADAGGLVNRISKRPTETPFGEVRLGFGTYDRIVTAFDVGGPALEDGSVLYRVTGLGRFGDAEVDYDFDQTIPNERRYLAPAVTWRPNDRVSLTLLGAYLKDDAGQEAVFKRDDNTLTHIRVDQPGFDDFDYRHFSVGYQFDYRFAADWTFRQNLRFSNHDYEYQNLFQAGLLADGRTLERFSQGFRSNIDGVFVDSNVSGTVRTGILEHQVLVGVDYANYRDRTAFAFGFGPNLDLLDPDYNQVVAQPDFYSDVDSVSDYVGLYIQDQITVDEHWLLTLGGRQDWYDSSAVELFGGTRTEASGDAFTYRAGLTYLAPGGVAPYVSYAESFLPSGTDEFGQPFEPTTGQQYEVGVKYQPPAADMLVTLALYDLTKQNVLTPAPTATQPNRRVQTGEIQAQGLEIEITAEPFAGLSLQASYTYTATEITSTNVLADRGRRAALFPRHMASAWAEYTFDEGAAAGLSAGLGVRHVGATFANTANTIRNDANTLVDLGLRYDLVRLDGRLAGGEASLNVTNLLDETYQTCFSIFDCSFGAPRTVLGTLSYRW